MARTGKGKSARKPLADISNSRNLSKPSKKSSESKKKISEDEDGALDRLLVVHSDLSNLIHQIDDLVSQAFQLKLKSEMDSQEIQSFMHVLSDMHSSLKVWVPRFQQAFSCSSADSDNQLVSSAPVNTVSAENDERKDVDNNVDELELSSLISPSPLVSWHAGCRVESGRQLFLLTPFPRSKVLSSRHSGPSRPVSEKVADAPRSALSLPPSLTISEHSHDDMLGVEVKSPQSFPKFSTSEKENMLEFAPVSSPQFSNSKNIEHSMYLITPMSKMSPPKTCVLLEPISESLQNNNDIPKWKPLAARNQNCDKGSTPENCSGHVSGIWVPKYPELFGFFPPNHKSAIKRESVEASPCFSPPKTCVLMEPPTDVLANNLATSELRISECVDLVSMKEKDVFVDHQSTNDTLNSELLDSSLADTQSTPMWMGSVGNLQTGKRPGENTLKRELWTKFEAVSMNPLRLDFSVFQGTKGKGFLDRLEEASHED